MSLENILEDLEGEPKKLIRPPFGYPGGKLKMRDKILPHLPYRSIFVEPFCGSCAIMIAKSPSNLEIANDLNSGLIRFYKSMQNSNTEHIKSFLEQTVNSREEFYFFVEEIKRLKLEQDYDPVSFAAMFIYIMARSFSKAGKIYSRNTAKAPASGATLDSKVKSLDAFAKRIKDVRFENRDWLECVKEYDSEDTVFYFDPPYIEATTNKAYLYQHMHQVDYQKHLISAIKHLKGFVAISGYAHPVYDDEDFWTDRIEWDQQVTMCRTSRSIVKEVLWIKE